MVVISIIDSNSFSHQRTNRRWHSTYTYYRFFGYTRGIGFMAERWWSMSRNSVRVQRSYGERIRINNRNCRILISWQTLWRREKTCISKIFDKVSRSRDKCYLHALRLQPCQTVRYVNIFIKVLLSFLFPRRLLWDYSITPSYQSRFACRFLLN